MKKNRIVKIVMSAAAAACVAAMPVQAGESGEGAAQSQEEGGQAAQAGDPLAEGAQETQGPARPCIRRAGALSAEEAGQAMPAPDGGAGVLPEGEPQEAEYSAFGGALEAGADLEEAIRRTGYGPHLLLLKEEEEPQEPQEPQPQPPAYSEEDLYILAHAICGEGQGYPDEEQLYIGSVILNRRAHASYPDTIKGVVFQRGQYACTRDGNYYREPTQANWQNARWLLENGSILPENVVYQARFRQGSGLYAQTRYHKYCYR